MATATNKAKNVATATSKQKGGYALWGDTVITWGDISRNWGSPTQVVTNLTRHTATTTNKVKN